MPGTSPPSAAPFEIFALGYVERFVTDLDRARAFHADVFGMQISAEDERNLYLRALHERAHHSLIITQGQEPAAGALGFRLRQESDLEKAHRWFTGRGLPGEWIERPWTGARVLRTADPWGVPLEFHCAMRRMPPLHQRFRLHHGARPLHLAHLSVMTPDVGAAAAFYGALGLPLSEAVRDTSEDRLHVAVLGCAGRGQMISFRQGPEPRLHHLAYRVDAPARVIDFLDLLVSTGHAEMIEHGPGRHGISNTVYLYLLDAEGHRIGLSCAESAIREPDAEPIEWDAADSRWERLWGAPPPASWNETALPFAERSARRRGGGAGPRARS